VEQPDDAHYGFPAPRDVTRLRLSRYQAIGFSKQKVHALLALARAIEGRRLDLEWLAREDDEVCTRLLELRGVGRWTAEYVLLRGLGRLHVFPGDDVGAQKRLARWLGRPDSLDYAGVRRESSHGNHTPASCTSIYYSTACGTLVRWVQSQSPLVNPAKVWVSEIESCL
jgi:DNA-3-methyladenine glycosylase II